MYAFYYTDMHGNAVGNPSPLLDSRFRIMICQVYHKICSIFILMNYVKHSSDVAAYIKLDDHWDVMWYGILMTKIGIVILLGAKIKT